MKNKVIKALTIAHGKIVVAYWKSVGIDVLGYPGRFNEKDGDISIYYGVINEHFRNYTFSQVEKANAEIIEIPHDFLIGKKIRRNGEIGTIESLIDGVVNIKFEDGLSFWYNYTEAFDYFVDEETIKEVEIPALGVGVLMLVSNDNIDFNQRFVMAKTKNNYLAWTDAETAGEINFKSAKFWKFAKPIEHKVILTKQDISDGKGVGVEPVAVIPKILYFANLIKFI